MRPLFRSPFSSAGRIYYTGVFVILATLLATALVVYPKVKEGNERNKAEAARKEQAKLAQKAANPEKPVSADGTTPH